MLHHAKTSRMALLSIIMLTTYSLKSAAPLQISPPPPPDPILANQATCLTNTFDPSIFTPTGLGSITWQFNSYISPIIAVNPRDKKNLVTVFARDKFEDSSGLYFSLEADTLAAVSKDGGETWTVNPVQPVPCLGGTVSQTISKAGFPLSFSKKGTLYFSGTFADTQPFDGRPTTQAGIFVQKSLDGGITWSDPVIVDFTNSSAFARPINQGGFVGGSGNLQGNEHSILFTDPCNDAVVHLIWERILYPSTLYGNIWYSRSTDEANTFSPATVIYELFNDPVWEAEYFNPNFPLGGQCIGTGIVSVTNGKKRKDPQTLLAGFIRLYPKKNVTVYTQEPTNSLFDHGIIFSRDNGVTWTNAAVALPQYTLAFTHNPTTGQPPSFSLTVSDGALNVPMVVSPKTKRVYLLSQNGNSAVNSDPEVNQFYPLIALYRSADKGKTWSDAATVSRTPLNTNPLFVGANQSFNGNIATLPNGLVGIIYNDFRNYNGSVGPSATLATDVWLAIYKEVADINGGSTGIGLDFVEELRLTPSSFNALIGFNSAINGIGQINGIAARKCKFVTAFGQTVQGSKQTQLGIDNAILDPNNRLSIFFEKVESKH